MAPRKTIKHYEQERTVHELTFSCYKQKPLLTNDQWRAMLSKSISAATQRHAYHLLAFVFMPEHVHLLVLPATIDSRISGLLRAIKRPFSYRIKQLLIENESPLLDRLTVHQRPGTTTFRFWQEGPGYDRNLYSREAIEASIDYFHQNPVRRKLCLRAIDWRWSSARYYLDREYQGDPQLPRIDGLKKEVLE